jgi:hypothetical protein
VYKTLRWIEDTLIQSRVFSLAGRKARLKSDMNDEVVLVDATETPIQRPQKTEMLLFRKERAAHA